MAGFSVNGELVQILIVLNLYILVIAVGSALILPISGYSTVSGMNQLVFNAQNYPQTDSGNIQINYLGTSDVKNVVGASIISGSWSMSPTNGIYATGLSGGSQVLPAFIDNSNPSFNGLNAVAAIQIGNTLYNNNTNVQYGTFWVNGLNQGETDIKIGQFPDNYGFSTANMYLTAYNNELYLLKVDYTYLIGNTIGLQQPLVSLQSLPQLNNTLTYAYIQSQKMLTVVIDPNTPNQLNANYQYDITGGASSNSWGMANSPVYIQTDNFGTSGFNLKGMQENVTIANDQINQTLAAQTSQQGLKNTLSVWWNLLTWNVDSHIPWYIILIFVTLPLLADALILGIIIVGIGVSWIP
jgi:hypothetical protein